MATIDDVYEVVVEIKKHLIPEPRPEQIFTCAVCGKPITAYGTKGEAFVTIGDKYYHNKCARGLRAI